MVIVQDRFGRNIIYLRIAITDRCNLRCRYCTPQEERERYSLSSLLSAEQIVRFVQASAKLGIRKVRITGGEPLMRRDLPSLIAGIAATSEIDDIALTTNGILFADQAKALKEAGLKRVNFSLDSLTPDTFSYITRGGCLEDVRRSIDKALELQLHPVKLNVVVMRGINDREIGGFARLAVGLPLHIRFIELMPVGGLDFFEKGRLMVMDDIKSEVQKYVGLEPYTPMTGNGPAKYYRIKEGQGTIGFISAMSCHFCPRCNRIRMTADGKLRSCLTESKEVDVRAALQNGASDQELRTLIGQAILAKPQNHRLKEGWGAGNSRIMSEIGG